MTNSTKGAILMRPVARLRKPRLYFPATDKVFFVLRKTLESEYGLTIEELAGMGKKQEYVYMRQVIMALLNRETAWIDKKIAGLFNLNHSTIHHATKQVNRAISGYDNKLKRYYDVFNSGLIKAGHYELGKS